MFVKHSCTRSVEQKREIGYRGNAVSSSVKNSVGERHRIERFREVKRRQGRSGSGAGWKKESGIERGLAGDGGHVDEADVCYDVSLIAGHRLRSVIGKFLWLPTVDN